MKERISAIRQLIQERGEVAFSELETLFTDFSAMTLRRDLKKLEDSGDVIVSKGIIKSISHLSLVKEELYSKRSMENTSEKSAIAKKALSFIKEQGSYYLDSGTTIMNLARLIDRQKLFIVTSAPNIALECVKNPNADIFLIGGNLNRDNLSLSGMNSLAFLDEINIDTAFMAAAGFSLKNGFSCGNFMECEIKKKVVKKAGRVIMLVDNTKFGKSLPFTFANIADIDAVISDNFISKEYLNQLGNKKIY